MTIIKDQIAFVQRQFDEHADLNNEPHDVHVFAILSSIFWTGPHKVTGEMVTGRWRGDIR